MCNYDAPPSAHASAHASTPNHVPARAGSPERDRDRRTIASLEQRLQSMEGVVRGLVATQANQTDHANQATQAYTAIDHNPPTPASNLPVAASMSLRDGVDGMASIAFSDETSSGAFGMPLILPTCLQHPI
jgi:hypothetical protein